MYNVSKLPAVIEIGYAGENLFRAIEIDMRPWLEVLPEGTASIVHIRPGETEDDAYVTAATMNSDGILIWTPTSADLGTAEGYGRMEVYLVEVGTVTKRGKSAIAQTFVKESISGEADPPAPQTTWLEQMTALKTATETAATAAGNAKTAAETAQGKAEDAQAAAEEAMEHAPMIGTNGNWHVWDVANGVWVDTGIAARGPAGERGIQGEQGAQGVEGPQGPAGRDGNNGVVVSVDADNYAFYVDEDGHLILVYNTATAPAFSINESGHLILTI